MASNEGGEGCGCILLLLFILIVVAWMIISPEDFDYILQNPPHR